MVIYVASRKLDIADSAWLAAISTRNVLRVEIGSGEAGAKVREWGSFLGCGRRLVDSGGHKNTGR